MDFPMGKIHQYRFHLRYHSLNSLLAQFLAIMNTTSSSNNEYNNLIELIVNSVSSKLMKAIEPRLLNIEHKLDQLVEHSTVSIAQKNSKNKKKKKKNIVSDIEKKKSRMRALRLLKPH